MNFWVAILLALLFITDTFGQKNQVFKSQKKQIKSKWITTVDRLEIPINEMGDDWYTLLTQNDDILVINKTSKWVQNNETWHFYLINKNLKIVKEFTKLIPRNHLQLFKKGSTAQYNYLFFSIENKNNFFLLQHQNQTDIVTYSHIEMPFNLQVKNVELLDNQLLIIGNYNDRPVALLKELTTGKNKVLPGFYNFNDELFDVNVDKNNQNFTITLAEFLNSGTVGLKIKNMTAEGLIVLETLVKTNQGINLINGKATTFENGMQYVLGMYSDNKNRALSKGVFISKLIHGELVFFKKYSFGDLSNYFLYRGFKAKLRISKKIEKKREKGKELKYTAQIVTHRILREPNQLLFAGEGFYAKYSHNNYQTFNTSQNTNLYSYYNDVGVPAYRNFLGYKFTHTFIAGFNLNGDLLWDNCFKTNEITNKKLEKTVTLKTQNHNLLFFYLVKNSLKTTVISENNTVEKKISNPIQLKKEGDVLRGRYNENSGVRNWYGDFLVVYGKQRIRNKIEKKIRNVFFINKIIFDSKHP